MNDIFSFNKRYFVIGVIVFIISVYIGLNTNISQIKPTSFYVYTVTFTVIITTITVILCCLFRRKRSLVSTAMGSLAIILIFISGYSRTFYVDNNFNKDRETIINSSNLCGIVTSPVEKSSSGKSYAVNADIYTSVSGGEAKNLKKPIKALLYFPVTSDSAPALGESFECSYSYELLSYPSYEGAFDYSKYLKQKNICCTVYCSDYKSTNTSYDISFIDRVEQFGLRLRSIISVSCDSSILSEDEKALLKGILLGDDSGFSDALYESYTDSGLVHIISVSGMHTSYLFLALSLILSFLRIPKKVYPFIAIPVLILFGAVALFTPSVSRSVIMLSILLLAPLFSRKNDNITALAISAAIIILYNPYSLESYSLLLSYGATLGILIYSNLLFRYFRPYTTIKSQNKYLKHLNAPIQYAIRSMCLTAGGVIGTSYFTSRFFNKIPLAGLFANILVFPLVAVAFIAGFINCLFYYFIPSISHLIMTFILKPSLYLTNQISYLFAKDFMTLETPFPKKSFFIVYIVILFVVFILLRSSIKQSEKS